MAWDRSKGRQEKRLEESVRKAPIEVSANFAGEESTLVMGTFLRTGNVRICPVRQKQRISIILARKGFVCLG
jgi:hypothetical protein